MTRETAKERPEVTTDRVNGTPMTTKRRPIGKDP